MNKCKNCKDSEKQIKELEKGLINAGGAAKKMDVEQFDNLEGMTNILNTEWEGLVLSLLSGNGAFSKISKAFVEIPTEILSLIQGVGKLESEMDENEKTIRKYAEAILTTVKVVGTLLGLFITYRAVMVATNAITKPYTVTTNALKVAQAFMSGGLKAATLAQKGLNLAMKANPIGLLIT